MKKSKTGKPNFALLKTIRLMGKTQGQIVREGGIGSESRFTRIIRGYVQPTNDEIRRICRCLNTPAAKLGFCNHSNITPNNRIKGANK